MGADDEAGKVFAFCDRDHGDGLDGGCVLEEFAAADVYGFVAGSGDTDGVFCIGLLFLIGGQAVGFGWCFEFDRCCLAGFVGGQFCHGAVRFSGERYRNAGPLNRSVIDSGGHLHIQLTLIFSFGLHGSPETFF